MKFKNWNCDVLRLKYHNGRTALQLVDSETGEPIATASVNLDIPMEADEIAIKDYSENEGMLDALRKAGIVTSPHRFVDGGYVRFPICQLLPES